MLVLSFDFLLYKNTFHSQMLKCCLSLPVYRDHYNSERKAEPHAAQEAVTGHKMGHPVLLRDTFHGCTSTGLYSLTIPLPHGRKPNQVPYNASPYVCDKRAYLPSQPVLHSAWFGRPLENYFTGSCQDSASLCLRHWPSLLWCVH